MAGLQLRDRRTTSSLGIRFGGSMKVGDLVMYMGHVGILLGRDSLSNDHWEVWFIEYAAHCVVYGPLMEKYEKIT